MLFYVLGITWHHLLIVTRAWSITSILCQFVNPGLQRDKDRGEEGERCRHSTSTRRSIFASSIAEEYNEKLEYYKKEGIEKDLQVHIVGGCWWAKERESLRFRECFSHVLQSTSFFASSFWRKFCE